jgi:hypothetical protein
MSDSFIIRGDNSIDFPNYDDPPQLIRPLYELVFTVDEFCERMGFPVYEEPSCYNGIPVASRVHLNNKQTFWQEMFTWPTNKSPLDWSITQVLTFIARNPRIYLTFLKTMGVIIALSIAGYLYNQYQMRIRRENEQEDRRILRERLKRKKER